MYRVINLQVVLLPGNLLDKQRAEPSALRSVTQPAGLHYHPGSASSTPVLSRIQLWTAVKGRTTIKLPQQLSVQLENKFSPLLQDPGSPSDDLDNISSSHSRIRTESNLGRKRLQGKLTNGPQTLTVGDSAVKDGKSMCSKNTKIGYGL